MNFHLKKLEFSPPKDALCHVWLKWAKKFWRRRFLYHVYVFSLFRYFLPLENGMTLHLNKPECPLPKDAMNVVQYHAVLNAYICFFRPMFIAIYF